MKMNKHLVLFTLIVFLIPLKGFTQMADEQTTLLDEFKGYFEGTWHGMEKGSTGDGAGTRTYELIVQNHYLLLKNQSVFAPDQKNTNREFHEDFGVFSFDQSSNKIVYRQFLSEGFVNTYNGERHMTGDAGSPQWVFETREIENLPPGWKARITIQPINENKFRETFELAQPGQEYQSMLNNIWIKISR